MGTMRQQARKSEGAFPNCGKPRPRFRPAKIAREQAFLCGIRRDEVSLETRIPQPSVSSAE